LRIFYAVKGAGTRKGSPAVFEFTKETAETRTEAVSFESHTLRQFTISAFWEEVASARCASAGALRAPVKGRCPETISSQNNLNL